MLPAILVLLACTQDPSPWAEKFAKAADLESRLAVLQQAVDAWDRGELDDPAFDSVAEALREPVKQMPADRIVGLIARRNVRPLSRLLVPLLENPQPPIRRRAVELLGLLTASTRADDVAQLLKD